MGGYQRSSSFSFVSVGVPAGGCVSSSSSSLIFLLDPFNDMFDMIEHHLTGCDLEIGDNDVTLCDVRERTGAKVSMIIERDFEALFIRFRCPCHSV